MSQPPWCHPISPSTFTHQLARSGETTAVPHSRSLSLCARVLWQVLLELEHPNIIPVHDISREESGEPMIVMKRIEGEAWSALISPEGSEGAVLERHIDILRQVANAVHYAHSKGLIHRDLKPDNVMLGPFGEVYVLDWGIAVAFDTTLTDLPQTRVLRYRLSGTLAAPVAP